MDIKAFRAQYPQYGDMSDDALADTLYQKHYSDIPRDKFEASFRPPEDPRMDQWGEQFTDRITHPENYGQHWNPYDERMEQVSAPGRTPEATIGTPRPSPDEYADLLKNVKSDEDFYPTIYGRMAWDALSRTLHGHEGPLTDKERAKNANTIAMSDMLQQNPSFVADNYDALNKKMGLMEQPPAYEFIPQIAMAAAVVLGVGILPLWKMVLGLAGFEAEERANQAIRAYHEGKPYSQVRPYGLYDLPPDDASDATKTALKLVDIVVKGKALSVGFSGLVKGWDAFAYDKINEVLPSQRFYIPGDAIRKWSGAGTEGGEGPFADILGDLKKRDILSNDKIKDSVKYGLDIEVDPQKVVGMTDSPAWAKIKGVLRVSPYEEVTTEPAQVRAEPGKPQLEALAKQGKESAPEISPETKQPIPEAPKSPVARQIGAEAQKQGVPSDVMTTVWSAEGGVTDPVTKNPISAATGIFQFMSGTWKAMGGTAEDRFDLNRQIELGVSLTKKNIQGLTKDLGRAPQAWEVYLAHQQGEGVARSFINAFPEAKAAGVLAGGANISIAEAKKRLSANGMDPSGTVQQALDFIKGYVDKHSRGGGTRGSTHTAILDNPNLPTETKQAMTQDLDARAVAWSGRTGEEPEEYYRRYVADADVPMVGGGELGMTVLRPSVQVAGQQYDGEFGEQHDDLLKRNKLPVEGEGQRGFATPDGKFLTRDQAEQWIKKNQPDAYENLKLIEGQVHAKEYARAVQTAADQGRGLEKSGAPTKNDLRVPSTKSAFNKVIKRLGGKALTRKDVASRALYKKKLKPDQLNAYRRAYALWNAHGGDTELIHAALDAEGEAPQISLLDIIRNERGSIGDDKLKQLKIAPASEAEAKVDRMVEDASRRSGNPIYELNREYDRAAFGEGLDDKYSPVQQEAARRAAKIIKETEATKLAKFEKYLTDQAKKTYSEDPIYQMVRELIGMKSVKDSAGKSHMVASGHGISISSMSDWGRDTVTQLTRRFPGLFRQKGGTPIDEIALDYGYDSSDALVEALRDLPTKQAYIDSHVTAGINRYGKELELVEVERQQVFVDEELKVMREAAGSNLTEEQRAGAEDATVWNANTARGLDKIIDRQTGVKVADVAVATDYDNLKAAIKMAARSSAKAYRAGKIDEAITQKQRQAELLNKLKLSIETKKAVGRIIGAIRKTIASQSVPWEWKQYVIQAIQPWSGLLGKTPKGFQAPQVPLRQFLEDKSEFNPLIMQALDKFQAIAGKPFGDFTLQDLKDLYSFVKGMEYAARTEGKFIGKMKKQDFLEAIKDILGQIGAPPSSPKSGLIEVPSQRWTEKAFHAPAALIADCIRPDVMFRALQGGKMFAALYDYMEHPFYEARMGKINLDKADSTELSRIIKSLGSLKGWKKPFDLPSIKARFSKMQIFKIALNLGNEGNYNAVISGLSNLTGRKVTEAHLQMITGQLSREEWQAVQDIWKLVDKYDLLNGVYKELTGQPMSRVEKRPFMTPYGMVSGGYYPLVADPRLSEKAAGQKWEEDVRLMFESPYQSARTKDGFTIERKGMRDLPYLDGLSDLTGHLQDTNMYVSYAVPLRDVIKIARNPAFKTAFSARLGKEMYDQLLPWLQGIARRGQRADTALETYCDFFRKNATFANLGLGLWTGIKHTTMPFFTAHEVGFAPTMRGIGKFLASPSEMGAFIDERSPMMEATRKRWDREIAAVRDQFDFPIKSKLSGMLADTAFLFIHMVVNTARRAAWLSQYDAAMNKYAGDESKAIEHADKTVTRMSGSFYPQEMPKVMRKSGLFRLVFTMFHTLGSNKFNRFWEAYRIGMDAKDKGSYRWVFEQIRGLWWLLLAPPITLAVIRDMIGPKRQHIEKGEYGEFFGDVVSEVAGQAADALPMVRDVASYTIHKIEAGRAEVNLMPLERMVQLLGDLIARPFAQQPVKPDKDIEMYLDMLGYGTGFPALNTLRLYRGITGLSSGQETNPAILFMRPPAAPVVHRRAGPLKINLR